MSKEHVVSSTALAAAFGVPLRNVVSGTKLGDRTLYDHEQTIRDVCTTCNSALSPYDTAGAALVKALIPSFDGTGLIISWSRETTGWLLKTHLNHIRMMGDAYSGDIYPINQDLKDSIVNQKFFDTSLFRLFYEGWQGAPYFWDANDPRHVNWIGYKSIRYLSQRIILSSLRLKTIDTWLMLPCDGDYQNFDARVKDVLAEVLRDLNASPEPLDTAKAESETLLLVSKVLPLSEVMTFVRRVPRNGA